MIHQEGSVESISCRYDVDALLNYRDGELGAFHAGYFDSSTPDCRSAMENLVKKATLPLKEAKCPKVLDVGCGFGYPTMQAQAFLQTDVTGIDFSKKSIDLARDLHSVPIQTGQLRFLQMSAYELTFADESFDGVFAVESLFHMDKRQAIQEIYRVLRTGGVVSICDYHQKEGWQGLFQEGFSAVLSLEAFVQVMKDCGFKEIQVADWTEFVKPSYDHMKNRKMIEMVQKDWQEFCGNIGTTLGYANLRARK